jgi:Ti-type conjugative transfer relaxase TraA
MAIYHFHGQLISRSAGRSAVAAAAYRSAELLIDERTELTHDFCKKEHDILHKEILTPENAPAWMKDRKKLWNEVEKGERRKDAQLAREFNIALPRELTNEQNIELARTFVQKNFVDKGMVADLCIHKGHCKDDEEQPHIHVMLTMREVTPDGFGKKVREWNSKELINEWRKAWAQEANFFLAINGHDMRIDNRRLEEQGIELEPQTKIGPKAAYNRLARYEEHQQIARANGEQIYQNPQIALNALINQQSTFTHQDIARFINRQTADKAQFDRVYARVKSDNELIFLGKDDLNRERFTTREMLELETRMVKRAIDKSTESTFLVSAESQAQALKTRSLSEEQKAAFLYITKKDDFLCIKGYAGTGKSYMLGAAREAWEQAGYRVQGMTASGKAAERLEISSNIRSNTIANRLINWEHEQAQLSNRDIVVIDEASMVCSQDMAKIIDEAYRAKAKLVLVGDIEQIQAIQAGAAFRSITEHIGYIEMTDIRRQHEKWQQEATKQFATGNTAEGLLAYEEKGHVHSFNTKAVAMDAMIGQWDETRSNQPDKSLLMMAYTREDVKSLNERAREIRKDQNELGEGHNLQTARGKREFAENDRVYFLQNNKELQVKNGTLGTIKSIDDQNNLVITVDREDGKKPQKVKFNINEYNHIEHGYAATVHKAQGSTIDYGYVLASRYFDRQIIYPAMSRHRENVELYWSRDEFVSFNQVAKSLGRENQKEITLDYIKHTNDYAKSRGIEPAQTNERVAISKPEEISWNRIKAAEDRLIERQFRESFGPEVRRFELDTGKKVSVVLKAEEQGIYKGTIKFGGQRYGVLQQVDEVKLIPYENCQNLERGHVTTIKMTRDKNDKEVFKAIQQQARSWTKEKSKEIELDFGIER